MWQALIIITVLVVVGAGEVAGWGRDAHQAICTIAEGRLSARARRVVSSVLRNEKLGKVCSWADDIKSKWRYKWTRDLHYINVRDSGYQYYRPRDCPRGKCIDGAIQYFTQRLLRQGLGSTRCPSTSSLSPSFVQSSTWRPRSTSTREDLKFLAHFIGDIHQPLHVGRSSDRGGTTLYVYWYSKRRSIHRVWDTEILRKTKREQYKSSLAALIKHMNKNISRRGTSEIQRWETFRTNWPQEYVHESISNAQNFVYSWVSSGTQLRDVYYNTVREEVHKMLAMSAVRLAKKLNELFG